MTDLELGWVAGILEGEGCFSAIHRNHYYPRITVASIDEDTIIKLKELTGGKVYGPYIINGNKPLWKWMHNSLKETVELLKQVLPLMGQRRRAKILEILNLCDKPHTNAWHTKTSCSKGHEYTADNTRYYPNGRRLCRICNKEYRRERYYALKEM